MVFMSVLSLQPVTSESDQRFSEVLGSLIYCRLLIYISECSPSFPPVHPLVWTGIGQRIGAERVDRRKNPGPAPSPAPSRAAPPWSSVSDKLALLIVRPSSPKQHHLCGDGREEAAGPGCLTHQPFQTRSNPHMREASRVSDLRRGAPLAPDG